MRCYYEVIEAGAELTGDAHFGLSYIETVTPAAIGAVGFLAIHLRGHSDRLRQSADRVRHFRNRR